MDMIASIQNQQTGTTFRMRLVRKGDLYGRNNCLTHKDDRPMVEFYDARHAMDVTPEGTMLGQFVSRYYVETLLESRSVGGLCLDGGVPDWTLCAGSFRTVQDILRNWTGR